MRQESARRQGHPCANKNNGVVSAKLRCGLASKSKKRRKRPNGDGLGRNGRRRKKRGVRGELKATGKLRGRGRSEWSEREEMEKLKKPLCLTDERSARRRRGVKLREWRSCVR